LVLSQAIGEGLFYYKIYDESRGFLKGSASAVFHIITKMYVKFVHNVFVFEETVGKLASNRLGKFLTTPNKGANQTRIDNKEIQYLRSNTAIKSASVLALVTLIFVGVSFKKAMFWAPTLLMGLAGVAAPFLLNPARVNRRERVKDNWDNFKDICSAFWWGLEDNVESLQDRLIRKLPYAQNAEDNLQIQVLDMVDANLGKAFDKIPAGDRSKVFKEVFGADIGDTVLELTEYISLFHQTQGHYRRLYGRPVLPAIYKLLSYLTQKTRLDGTVEKQAFFNADKVNGTKILADLIAGDILEEVSLPGETSSTRVQLKQNGISRPSVIEGENFDNVWKTLTKPLPKYFEKGTVEKTKISKVGLNGDVILSELIKNGVLEDVSSTEVRLKGNLDKNEDKVREIAKDDFDKIWDILQQSQKSSRDGLAGYKEDLSGAFVISRILQIESIIGTILDPNNSNGVWREFSPTEVQIKPGTVLSEDGVRKIVVKGTFLNANLNADQIWEELTENGYIGPNDVILGGKLDGVKEYSDLVLPKRSAVEKEKIYDILKKTGKKDFVEIWAVLQIAMNNRLSAVKKHLEILKKVESLKEKIVRAEGKELKKVEDILKDPKATFKQLDEADRLLTELSWLPLDIQGRESKLVNFVMGLIGVDATLQAVTFYLLFPVLRLWDKVVASKSSKKDYEDSLKVPQSTIVPSSSSSGVDKAMGSVKGTASRMIQPVFEDSAVTTAQQIIDKAMQAGSHRDIAHRGGIDLSRTEVDVQSSGDRIQTAFDDPAMLRLLLNSDGLTPIIYDIKTMTPAMVNNFVGLN
jgi:hypothetical protein